MTVILSKIDFRVKYIRVKQFFKEINCKTILISNTVCGRRIQFNVMFRGTPCTKLELLI